jgi:hypothetical protein
MHKHTFGSQQAAKAAKLGYSPIDDAMVKEMVNGMKAAFANPNSAVSQYTKHCRANGIPCLQDQLDAGKTLEQSIRESIFVK